MPRTFPEVSTCTFCPRVKTFRALLSHLRSFRKTEPAATAGFFHLVLLSVCLMLLLHSGAVVHAQNTTATLTGTVSDPSGAVVPGVNVSAISIAQGFERSVTTNEEGTYVIPSLPPGEYRVKAEHEGFQTIEVRNVILNVNAYTRVDISLKIPSVEQKVEVLENPSLIDETPSVGVTVDARLVKMPLNGRSFQQLLSFLPGIVITKATGVEQGQFSVNGQRANANYFSIDGVSGNIGVPTNATPGQSAGGSLPGLSASGGTNNLVSIDALQEFKVELSSYAAEFGRTPGAQVIIVTRSGTNDFHGSIFEIFRNDVLDANDWFANNRGQGKPPLRQNDFGAVLGGPLFIPRFGEGGKELWYNGKDRTFFFFSYEGLRLRQPSFAITQVPSLNARQAAPAGIRPYLNAFPRPTGPALTNNFAEFAAGFSNPSSFDATSLRIDHHVSPTLILFGRYNNSPSESLQRGVLSTSLNNLDFLRLKTQTLTGGATMVLSSGAVNELRANYSHNSAIRSFSLDSFGGATVPDDSILFPAFASSNESSLTFTLSGGRSSQLRVGRNLENLQRQVNIVDNLAVVRGAHNFKFGVDFRRLSPSIAPRLYGQLVAVAGVNGALQGRATSVNVQSQTGPVVPIYLNFSFFGQDNWRIKRRLTLTYGLRYEINPPPSEASGKEPATLVQIDDPRTFALAAPGQPLWKTTYNNFAPRFGVHFQLSQTPGRETALRGGYGIFYDLGTGVGGQAFISFPFSGLRRLANITFPLVSAADVSAPPIGTLPIVQLDTADPDLKLPYTHQWNVAVEQSLGKNQTISASYVAALGRRLLRQAQFAGAILSGNPIFSSLTRVFITSNGATSDYHSLQVSFQRRLTNRLQALSYYNWSHSIDTASSESAQFGPTLILDPNRDRGAADFDIRHSFNLALTYDLPTARIGKLGRAIFGDWTVDTIVAAHSGTPVDVTTFRDIGFGFITLRPDLIQGVPLYLDDPNVAGGRRFNPAAFKVPTQPRQGTLGRNVLRGFSLYQVDLGLGRNFKVSDALSFEFKAEFFNLFNHPNFGDPNGDFDSLATFGQSQRMYGRSLGSGGTLGGLNPLYQVGGPRSVQMSLKMRF